MPRRKLKHHASLGNLHEPLDGFRFVDYRILMTTVPVSWSPVAVDTLLDLIDNDCSGVLSLDHATSSRGLPVVVLADGTALGPGEVGELTVAVFRSLGHAPLTSEQVAIIKSARAAGYQIREIE